MRTRRSNNSTTTNGKKKERTSTPDLEASNSSISSSTAAGSRSDRKSPNSTNNKDSEEKAFNQKSKDIVLVKSKKRRFDKEEETTGKKKKDGSDSESGSESSSASGPEGPGQDGDSDANIQEDLSDSSRPSSPTSSIEPVRPQAITSASSSIHLSQDLIDKQSHITGVSSLVGRNSPASVVLTKDSPVNPQGALGVSSTPPPSKHISNQAVPTGGSSIQHTNPFLNSSNIPQASSGLGQLAVATSSLPQQLSAASSSTLPSPSSAALPGIPSSQHLRSSLHTPNSNHYIRPSLGPGPTGVGHISNIGSITNTNNHTIGSISANTTVACNFSPLVIPTPALSRASSTGTFIPRTELAVPSLSNPASTGTDSIAPAVAKTTLVSAVDSSISASNQSLAQRAQSSKALGPGIGNSSINSSNPVGNPNTSAVTNNSNPFSKMQQEPAPSEEQDKKPSLPHPVPSHVPAPPSFLPGHPGAVPFAPFHHYYYPQHPGAPHLPPHPSLHPAGAASGTSSSSASSSSSSSGPSPLSAPPPPVPSLVPIKKEAHSPPPPLKPSSESKSQSELISSSSLHALHRSIPPQDGAKIPAGFSQPGLPSSTAPIPPPPLTVIDHRDGKQSEDLSKPTAADHYSKESSSSLRGMNPSPHRPDSGLPPASLLHQSRMDSNLSILSESREIGLKGGIISGTAHPSLSSSTLPPSSSSSSSSSQPPLHPQLASIKEEPNSGLPHHPVPCAAFQPYPHHHSQHPNNPHHSGLPQTPNSQLPSHGPASTSSSSSSSSVLQVPQPHLSSGDHQHHQHHGGGGGHPQHHIDSSLHNPGNASRPGELLSNIKKEPVPVEEIHVDDEDDEPAGGSTTPGPPPTICNREFYKSNSAIFVKVFDRGDRNQCSRTDFIFKPLSGSNLAKKREERIRKASHSSSSSSSVREEKKRVETPPRATSASESQKSSGSGGGNNPSSSSMHQGPPTPYQDRHTPRQFTDTPALRQLHEYARPHVLNADPRAGPYSLAGLQHHPHVDPLIGYRLGMFPPGSRERLELELERDKRERDAREREMRERELREMELRDKMELKPGLDRLLPPGAASQLTDAASWLDLQRRMGLHPSAAGSLVPPGHAHSAVGSHVPGVYPPSSLASDLLAREREKLDRFGLATNLPQLAADMSYASAVERLSQERQAAERQAAERDRERLAAYANDPGARLQLASVAAATQHAHTHTHAHSHTHLHLHQQEVAAHAQAVAQAQAHGLTPPAFPLALGGHGPPLYPPHHPLAATQGGDPIAAAAAAAAAAGGPGGSGLPPSTSSNQLPVLPPGVMHHPLLAGMGNREELLQRELYSRSGHFIDPAALAHQLSAQAAAHEALQRQIAMERERFGSSSHLPH